MEKNERNENRTEHNPKNIEGDHKTNSASKVVLDIKIDNFKKNLDQDSIKDFVFQDLYINDSKKNKKEFKYKGNKINTTKYNIFTFFPKAILFQFLKINNFYFLTVAILQVTTLSPISPLTTAAFGFVIALSLIREAIEDYARYRFDKQINREKCTKLRNGKWTEVASEELTIGDIVLVKNSNSFTSDLVLLDSNLKDGICYIETSNLDGERNAKLKTANMATAGLFKTFNESEEIKEKFSIFNDINKHINRNMHINDNYYNSNNFFNEKENEFENAIINTNQKNHCTDNNNNNNIKNNNISKIENIPTTNKLSSSDANSKKTEEAAAAYLKSNFDNNQHKTNIMQINQSEIKSDENWNLFINKNFQVREYYNNEALENFDISGLVRCSKPNSNLYELLGNLKIKFKRSEFLEEKEIRSDIDKGQLLLKGSILRNCKWIIGVVVYTGMNTKIMLNSNKASIKFSKIDNILGRLFILVFFIQVSFNILSAGLNSYYYYENIVNQKYLVKSKNPALDSFLVYFTYMVLLNTMIPISLIITIELVKMAQSIFIKSDVNLFSRLRYK